VCVCVCVIVNAIAPEPFHKNFYGSEIWSKAGTTSKMAAYQLNNTTTMPNLMKILL